VSDSASRPNRYALVLLCPLSLAAMGMFIKLSGRAPVSLLLLARFAVPAVVYTAVLKARRYAFAGIRAYRHVPRAILGLASVACLFASIVRIPLSTSLCLSYTIPFFTYTMSLFSGKATLDWRGGFVVTALAGVACITGPNPAGDIAGIGLALASAFFGAMALYEIKRVSAYEDPDAILLMYFVISTIGLATYVICFDRSALRTMHMSGPWPMLVLVGLSGMLYQISLVHALRAVSVSLVSMFLLFAVAIGFAVDATLFGTAFTPVRTIGIALLAASIVGFQAVEALHAEQ